jgi:hypothetical protein
MTRPKTPGGFANDAGNTLEQAVRNVLANKGFEVVKWSVYQHHPDRYGSELLLERVPYQTIYDHHGVSEFLLRSETYHLNMRIECKWQQSPGSVDEKFPYVYLNCVEAMPEPNVLILVDGGGAKLGAVQWLRRVAKEQRYLPPGVTKHIQVFTLTEFMGWANQTFR